MSKQTLESQVLENRIGTLAELYPQFKEGTWQTSAEITNDRRTLKDEEKKQELKDTYFYTANFGMYTIEDNDEFLYFGGREANPIFDNIGEATTQLLENQNYKPSEEGIKAVVASVQSGATLKVKLSDLELKGDNEEWRYFEINTADYDSLNKSQRALAERVYGQGNDFVENMKMLNEEDISTAKIYVLNPEYVKKNIEAGKALARACWLYNFGGISSFDANGRSVDNANNSLRGVPLVGEADTQEIENTYELLQKPAIQPIAADLLTQESATALSRVLTLYLAKGQE